MSFVAGSLAGALVTGGVYYGFSNLMQTRTAQHRGDLHVLSERFINATTTIPSPPPASTRITERPFAAMLQSRWNEEVAGVFAAVGKWERQASDWGRKLLYGEHAS
ncbi:hypothetical protein HYDPIDRAFT_89906 [Hydnomerulius pinastri MD-312]|uniref:MICOS complex subunit MIC12 n=1 Tax=Hydnomerulius pinastri MD-312 TaxID=994086 RepID=A0A0C9WFC8_9AGAM|nr:hypothetical protein HYDPIDRAFT_89906 [Hydnomerulius pinastri MD-312]